MNEPSWILTTFIGALVGLMLRYLIRAIVFVVRRFRRGMIDGKWYVYHATKRNGKLKIEPAMWDIRKGFNSNFVLKEVRGRLGTPVYEGNLSFERNFWLVKLNGIGHEEQVLIRLFCPVPAEDTRTWGLYLGIDAQGKPVAGPIMISRQELPTDDVAAALLEKTKVHSRMRLLTA